MHTNKLKYEMMCLDWSDYTIETLCEKRMLNSSIRRDEMTQTEAVAVAAAVK